MHLLRDAHYPSPLPRILRIALIGAVAGAGYGYFAALNGGGHDGVGIPRGTLTGAIISLILASFSIVLSPGSLGAPLRRAPFLAHLGAVSAIYLMAILLGLSAGQMLLPQSDGSAAAISRADVLFSGVVSVVIVFVLEVNRLLGQNVLLNFLTGRYHHPRVEDRIFLFIDLEGSTGFAEQLGEVRFHRLVNRFITDVSMPIAAHGGEMHKYVGDEVIVTWKLADGVDDARCVRACFAVLGTLAELAPDYERELGARISCRAGLHCGTVVTGEIGSLKKEIVFLGDTVNTTARIQDACRTTGECVLISTNLVSHLDLPRELTLRSLGPLHLRGKSSEIELFALAARERSAV